MQGAFLEVKAMKDNVKTNVYDVLTDKGKIFDSMEEASIFIGEKPKAISNCLNKGECVAWGRFLVSRLD
jgi:hypothetical protein